MEFPKTTWRVIEHPPARGAWNMAVDEAILESVYSGGSLPTLRLYAWQPACLSLGRTQPFAEANMQALQARGWDIVRRPTGGRAILHTDELTYAVIAPNLEPRVSGGVLESYLRLSRALLGALRNLGLTPEANETAAKPASGKFNPVCFEVPSNYEITVDGKKLIGSAQARRMEGILQHGALPLTGDLTRIITALQFENKEAQEKAERGLLAHATTVETITGEAPAWEDASKAFKQAFSDTLNLDLTPGGLSEAERERAQVLMETKYSQASWTERI
ncbi:MAG: lipoate--protein ligase family protein [Chloroflexota bacterium]|nr:lipoate--protein ligase family protein [Chloroflexota bacterium]